MAIHERTLVSVGVWERPLHITVKIITAVSLLKEGGRRTEGWKGGRKEGRTEGREEGRKEGRK